MGKGRKAIYRPEELEIGEKMQLKGSAKYFGNQYAAQFRKKNKPKDFKKVEQKGKVFIERTL